MEVREYSLESRVEVHEYSLKAELHEYSEGWRNVSTLKAGGT